MILLAVALAVMTARVVDRVRFVRLWQLWWLALVVLWPVTFMMVTAHWRSDVIPDHTH
jgi:hypothetical protein